MDEIPESLIKEVYAQFGLAYYLSEALHRGLCVISTFASFRSTDDMIRERLDEEFSKTFTMTLGQLVKSVSDIVPDDLRQSLDTAVEERNFLAHHFWWERNPLMFSEQGLMQLLEELDEMADLFRVVDGQVSLHVEPLLASLGVDRPLIASLIARGENGEDFVLPRPAKPPKALLRITKVWNVRVDTGKMVQVFEAKDGSLWQFCDVGLIRSKLASPSPEWEANEIISRYLPAEIEPRPKTEAPSTYTLRLADGALLRVSTYP